MRTEIGGTLSGEATLSGAGALTPTAKWIQNAAWAMIDQAVFGFSNFILNVMMARWLTHEGYGAFTLAYSLFLLLSTVHTGLLADPMIVFGARQYGDSLPAYLVVLTRGHWILTGLSSIVLAGAAIALGLAGQHESSTGLLALAVANPLMLLLWFARRSCYLRAKPRLAATANLCYMAVLVAGACALAWAGVLSTVAAFALMGAASVPAAFYIARRMRLAPKPEITGTFRRSVISDHLTYGRWAVAATGLAALTLYLYYLVLPATHGLEETATLRALMNLVLPAVQAFWILAVVNVPRLVKARGTPAFNKLLTQLSIIHISAAVLFWMVLGFFHELLVQLLYGGRYVGQSHVLWALGVIPVAIAAASTLETALRSGERADAIFHANLLAVICTCGIGLPLTAAWGIEGAAIGMISGHVCLVASMALSVRADRRDAASTVPTRA